MGSRHFPAFDQKGLDYQEEIALRHTPAKKNMTDALGSTRAASQRCSLKDCPASLPRAGYATAVSPTKMPYELASMRVADFERSIIQIGPRSASMRIASAGTTHRAHQSTRNGCRRPMRR